jgi:hypothetical protein
MSLSGGAMLACAGVVVCIWAAAAHAHDAIGSDARKAYLAKLDELHKTAQSSAAVGVRATARFQIGVTLDEISELLNQDIVSHGKTQGLETSLLVKQLDASPQKLEFSSQTRLYRANLSPFRDAIALDGGGKFANAARFMILKGQFYDSFTDDPIKPVAQTSAELMEMIGIGEALYPLREPGLDTQEIGFILAMHYLQAQHSGALPSDKARARFAELLREFRQRHAQSLKLATLEALSQ